MKALPCILAFDPGGTTGWACFDPNVKDQDQTISFGQFNHQEHHKDLFDFLVNIAELRITAPLHIVYERFDFRKEDQTRDKIEYISCEYIAVIKLFCKMYKNSGIKIIAQGSAQAVGKTAFFGDGPEGNRKMKLLGLYHPGQVHATDALRHYAYYRTFTLKDNTYLFRLEPGKRAAAVNQSGVGGNYARDLNKL